MRVVYILPTGPLYGDNIALRTILPLLTEQGVEPLIVGRAGSDSLRAFQELGYPCIGHEWYYSTVRTQPLWRATLRQLNHWQEQHIRQRNSEYRYLRDEVRRFAPDIIHTNCSFTNLGVRLADDLHLPHVMHIREYGELSHLGHYPTDTWFARSCRHQHRYNITITRDIQAHFHLLDTNTRPIYDGVFSGDEPYQLQEKKERYFLVAGRLTAQKGVLEAIQAFVRFAKRQSGYRLLIAGTGNDEAYQQRLHNEITNSGHSDDICLLGYRSDVGQLMQHATALLISSQFEGFGFTAAEALYHGCPVIGNNIAGIREQFINVTEQNKQAPMFRVYETSDELVEAMVATANTHISFNSLQLFHDHVAQCYPASRSAECVWEFYQEIQRTEAQYQ